MTHQLWITVYTRNVAREGRLAGSTVAGRGGGGGQAGRLRVTGEGGGESAGGRKWMKKRRFFVHYPVMLVMLACNHMLDVETCHGCTGQQWVGLQSHGVEFVMCSAGTGG